MNEKPLVSVVMITYGHQDYIRQAIQGVFLQKTNFLVELIIANDASPDNTDEVVNQVIKKAPEHIIVKYTKHSSNLGMMLNHHWAINQAQGKYIAICDGDDYWIEETKLQSQFDFLEKNPDYSICCHNFKVLNEDKLSEVSFFDKLKINDTSDIVDLSKNNIIPTLTAFFRNKKIVFPDWAINAPLGDLILFLNIAKYGKIKYINEKWAVYRQNVGVWHKNKLNYLEMSELYKNLANDYQDWGEVEKNLTFQKKKYLKAYLKELPISEIIKNENFNELAFSEKAKLLVRKLL